MEQPQIWAQDHAVRQPKVALAESRALVVDLEEALLRSNLVQEVLFTDAAGSLVCLYDAILSGKGAFLEQVVTEAEIDYAHLPYEPEVLNVALAARAQGRKIYIAARRYPHHAAAIASHLGFDGVVTLAELAAASRTGDIAAPAPGLDAGSFDYIGNGQAPERVWRAACTTYVVGGSDRLSERLELLNPSLKKIGGRNLLWRTWLNALRVHQYAKNTLVFVPALTSHQINLASLGSAFLAFLALSACASSAYLLNDLFDLAADRQHPTKRHRAIASGDLPISSALIAIPLLWIVSAAAGLCISGTFVAVLGAYLATTIAYSLYLKKKMLVDIVTLAGLYTIRIVGGAVAIGVYISEWLMIFSLFIFTSLALIKRYSELAMRQGSRLSDPANRDYRISDLQIVGAMAAASGMNAITVFSLYVSSPTVAQMYSRPWMLWLLNPLLLYWISRALMLAHRQAMHDDPIVYTFKDNASRIVVVAMMCIVLAAI
jgi:4-hydroxybenzoate polyprenyltransferase